MSLLSSLLPQESISTAISKLKGGSSKLIRNLTAEIERVWGGGYFAATTGANTSAQLDAYLENQAEHHGYDQRAIPPVWVQNWELSETDLDLLQTKRAFVVLRWHIVLATFNRVGVFTSNAAEAICNCWAEEASTWQCRFQKVSAVPDHIHVAVVTHPTVSPAQLALEMMNNSQELMRDRYPSLLIRAGQPRLWKPSAYVGSFGDTTKDHIRNYMQKWERSERARFVAD